MSITYLKGFTGQNLQIMMKIVVFTLTNGVDPDEKLHYGTVVYLVCFVALRPKSTAMVIAGRSVHLTILFPGQA